MERWNVQNASQLTSPKTVTAATNRTIVVRVAVVREVESYCPKEYSDEVKRHCLTQNVNGLGFRAIERCTAVNHNTVINWVKQYGGQLPNAPADEEIAQLTQVDELQTFVGSKKTKSGSGAPSTARNPVF